MDAINDIDSSPSVESSSEEGGSPSRLRKSLRWIGLGALFFWLLIVFTVFKIPEARINAYVQGLIAQQLAERGMSFSTAQPGQLSLWFGLSYTFREISLTLPDSEQPLKIDRLEVSPSLIPTLVGALTRKEGIDAKILLEQGKGSLVAKIHFRDGSADVSFTVKELDLGKSGILPVAAELKGAAIATGEGQFKGDLKSAASWNAKLDLKLTKIQIESQSPAFLAHTMVPGLKIPALSIGEGRIETTIEKGKIKFQNFKLGQSPANPSDDLTATLTGDTQLVNDLNSSTVNVKASFAFSERIKKELSFLDVILTPGKKADGSYSYSLAGPMGALMPTPNP